MSNLRETLHTLARPRLLAVSYLEDLNSQREIERSASPGDRVVGQPRGSRWPSIITALVISAITLAGCGNPAVSAPPSATVSASATPSESTAPTATPRPNCPLIRRGPCLGLIAAGTYTTVQFQPPITYTVPAGGWSNFEDLSGLFELLPPGSSIQGGEPVGDYIGIWANVVAANTDCTESEQPSVAHTASALAAEFVRRPGLTTTTPKPVSVGRLKGLVLDIRMADGWTKTCFYSQGSPAMPLIRGVGPSSGLDNPICDPGCTTRVYLLDLPDSALAIELGDNSGGTHLDAYSAIVEQLHFGS
jgi:hypothetical protein